MKLAYVLAFIDEDERIYLNDQILNQTRFFSLKKSAPFVTKASELRNIPQSELKLSLESAKKLEAKNLRKISLLVQITKEAWLGSRVYEGYYKSYSFLDSRPPKNLDSLSEKEIYLEKIYQKYEALGFKSITLEKGESLKLVNTPYFVSPQSYQVQDSSFKLKEVNNLRAVQHIMAPTSEVEIFEKEREEKFSHLVYTSNSLRSILVYFIQ